LFDCIQSVDSAKLAREIEKRCSEAGRATIDVLIEINVSGEEQKYGVRPADAEALVREVLALPHLKLRGLMTMAPYTEDEAIVRAAFSGLRTLAERLGVLFGRSTSQSFRWACPTIIRLHAKRAAPWFGSARHCSLEEMIRDLGSRQADAAHAL